MGATFGNSILQLMNNRTTIQVLVVISILKLKHTQASPNICFIRHMNPALGKELSMPFLYAGTSGSSLLMQVVRREYAYRVIKIVSDSYKGRGSARKILIPKSDPRSPFHFQKGAFKVFIHCRLFTYLSNRSSLCLQKENQITLKEECNTVPNILWIDFHCFKMHWFAK